MGEDRYLNIKEICQMLGVTRSTVYDWIKRRNFPSQKVLAPGSVRWSLRSVQAWIQSTGTYGEGGNE